MPDANPATCATSAKSPAAISSSRSPACRTRRGSWSPAPTTRSTSSTPARPTRRARDLADHGRYVTCVRLAGNTVISGGYDNRLIWWDLENNRAIRTTDDAHAGNSASSRSLPTGPSSPASPTTWCAGSGTSRTANASANCVGHEERTPTHFGSMLYCCAFSNDGTKLATGDRVGRVCIWNVANGERLSTVEVPSLYTWDAVQRIRSIGGIRSLAFSPDGTQIAVGGVGQIGNVDGLSGPSRVEVHNWARREKVYEFQGSTAGPVQQARLASAQRLAVRHRRRHQRLHRLPQHAKPHHDPSNESAHAHPRFRLQRRLDHALSRRPSKGCRAGNARLNNAIGGLPIMRRRIQANADCRAARISRL